MKNLKISDYIDKSPLFGSAAGQNILVFSSKSCKYILLKLEIWQELLAGNFEAFDERLLERLVNDAFLVAAHADELSEILATMEEEKQNTQQFQFTIQPSANCQLGCGYCGQVHENRNL